MSYIQVGTPTFRRALSALFSGALVTFAILYSVQPLLPVLAARFHVSPAQASLTLSISTLFMGGAMLLAAPLSLVWGPKRVMTISMAMAAVLAMATAIAPSFWMLIGIRGLTGIALAGLPAVAMGYVSDEFDPRALGRAMGIYVSGTTIGGMGGRILVGTLTDAWSWRGALGTIAAVSVALTVWFFRNLPPSRHFTPHPDALRKLWPSLRKNLDNRELVWLYVLPFLLMGGFVTIYNYITFLLTGAPYHLSQTLVGWVFLVYLAGTGSSAWLGRLADQHGRSRVLVIAIGLMLAGLLVTLLPPLAFKIGGLALMTFGFFGAHAVASGWVARRALTSAAEASSLYLFFYYAGSSIFGVLGGLVWIRWHWTGIIAMVGGLAAIALLVAAHLGQSRTR